MNLNNIKVAIIGLGYVGLPLLFEVSKHYKVIGYDININRINSLKKNIDYTKEVTTKKLQDRQNINFTNNIDNLSQCSFFIITVPTPITNKYKPDLKFLRQASKEIGKIIKPNSFIVYESTVYPGCTEEVCLPILLKYSGLTYNKNLFLGYSPERINPGDKKHTIDKIVKITSGSNKLAADFIDSFYSKIIKVGTHRVSTIRIAEAAKVIENTQRDLNIALVNELSIIFKKLNLDTNEILNAAATKWNFINFKPGLVGGHCIGIDPYYLTYKSRIEGYEPKFILSGRSINENMYKVVCNEIFKQSISIGINLSKANILILGIAFKDNCPDIRNSQIFRVIDFFDKLKSR